MIMLAQDVHMYLDNLIVNLNCQSKYGLSMIFVL